MNAEEVFEKEHQIYRLLETVNPGNTQRISYILGDKFVVGLRRMLNTINPSGTRELLYVFGNTDNIKINNGGIYGLNVSRGTIRGSNIRVIIYYKLNEGVNAIIYECKEDEGKIEVGKIKKVSYKRKPNGWNSVEENRSKLYNSIGNTDTTKNEESKVVESIIGKIVDKIENVEDKTIKFEVYGEGSNLGYNTYRGRASKNEIGFGVRGYDKEGEQVKIEGVTHYVYTFKSKDRLESYKQASKVLYDKVKGTGISLVNKVNDTEGIVYIKSNK